MTRWLLLLPLSFGPVVATASADDIWQRRDPRQAFLFQDNRARSVGDLITIIVNETTNTNEREQRALDKNTNANGTSNFGGAANFFNLSNAFRRRFTGAAQLTSNRVFQDRIAATVVDILPNGNLVIEGYRSRVVATEERVLRMTGIVRQQDVGNGNVVQSSSIANLKISYLGRGPATRTVNQNYFSRILNRLSPF